MELPDVVERMAAFLRGKGHILWDVTMNTTYVHPINFLAPWSRDMHDTNNKASDYLFHAVCPLGCYNEHNLCSSN
jgi:hypothetical protein